MLGESLIRTDKAAQTADLIFVQIAAENLISQRQYGQAVAYCVRANEPRRINKIADLILDEYLLDGKIRKTLLIEVATNSLLFFIIRGASLIAHRFHSHLASSSIFYDTTSLSFGIV